MEIVQLMIPKVPQPKTQGRTKQYESIPGEIRILFLTLSGNASF